MGNTQVRSTHQEEETSVTNRCDIDQHAVEGNDDTSELDATVDYGDQPLTLALMTSSTIDRSSPSHTPLQVSPLTLSLSPGPLPPSPISSLSAPTTPTSIQTSDDDNQTIDNIETTQTYTQRMESYNQQPSSELQQRQAYMDSERWSSPPTSTSTSIVPYDESSPFTQHSLPIGESHPESPLIDPTAAVDEEPPIESIIEKDESQHLPREEVEDDEHDDEEDDDDEYEDDDSESFDFASLCYVPPTSSSSRHILLTPSPRKPNSRGLKMKWRDDLPGSEMKIHPIHEEDENEDGNIDTINDQPDSPTKRRRMLNHTTTIQTHHTRSLTDDFNYQCVPRNMHGVPLKNSLIAEHTPSVISNQPRTRQRRRRRRSSSKFHEPPSHVEGDDEDDESCDASRLESTIPSFVDSSSHTLYPMPRTILKVTDHPILLHPQVEPLPLRRSMRLTMISTINNNIHTTNALHDPSPSLTNDPHDSSLESPSHHHQLVEEQHEKVEPFVTTTTTTTTTSNRKTMPKKVSMSILRKPLADVSNGTIDRPGR